MTEKTEVDSVQTLFALAPLQTSQANADALNRAGQSLIATRATLADRDIEVRQLTSDLNARDQALGRREADTDSLLDEMHSMAIENARLRGYMQRVHEFDPVSDKDLFQEETIAVPRRLAPLPRGREHHAVYVEEASSAHHGAQSSPHRPWYRRR